MCDCGKGEKVLTGEAWKDACAEMKESTECRTRILVWDEKGIIIDERWMGSSVKHWNFLFLFVLNISPNNKKMSISQKCKRLFSYSVDSIYFYGDYTECQLSYIVAFRKRSNPVDVFSPPCQYGKTKLSLFYCTFFKQ